MSQKLTVERKKVDGKDELVFTGPLTEETESVLSDLKLPQGLSKDLSFDLFGIKHVNSIGIRDWVLFRKRIEQSHTVVMKRCSPTFIMACNVVSSMLGKARIASANRGYQCPNNHYFWREVVIDDFDMDSADQKIPCEKCSLKAAPEYEAEEYFRFLDQ